MSMLSSCASCDQEDQKIYWFRSNKTTLAGKLMCNMIIKKFVKKTSLKFHFQTLLLLTFPILLLLIYVPYLFIHLTKDYVAPSKVLLQIVMQCWLDGAWPRFEVNWAKQIPTLLGLSTLARGVQTEVSPEVVWGDVGTKFLQPRAVWEVDLVQLWIPLHRSLHALS